MPVREFVDSWARSVLSAPKVLLRPSSTGERQRVRFVDGAGKLSSGVFRRACLKAQMRSLAFFGAGSAKVRRVPESVFAWLLCHDIDSSVSKTGELVVGKLLVLFYNCGAALFKFEVFVLEPRQLLLQQRLAALESENGILSVDELSQQVGGSQCDLAGVSFSNESLGNGFGPGDGRDGKLNFVEHGSPSDSSMRVEEHALSVGEGARPFPSDLSESQALQKQFRKHQAPQFAANGCQETLNDHA